MQDDLAERVDWPFDSVGDVLSRMLATSPLTSWGPPTATDIGLFRTRVAAAVRSAGKGRQFQ